MTQAIDKQQVRESGHGQDGGEVTALSNVGQDFAAVLLGKSRDLIQHLYANNGGWHAVVAADEEYGIPKSEIGLLIRNQQTIRQTIPPNSSLLELGPGDIETISKTFHVINAIAPSEYIAADLQAEFTRTAANTVNHRYQSRIPVREESIDFFNYPRPIETQAEAVTLLMSGCTLGQIPLATSSQEQNAITVGRAFDGFAKIVGKKPGYLIVTIDTTRGEDAVDLYRGEFVKEWLESFVDVLHSNKIGNNALSKSDFVYQGRWDEDQSCVRHDLVFKGAQSANFEIDGKSYSIQPAQVVPLGVSYKWTADQVNSVAQEHGWSPQATLTCSNHVRGLIFRHSLG